MEARVQAPDSSETVGAGWQGWLGVPLGLALAAGVLWVSDFRLGGWVFAALVALVVTFYHWRMQTALAAKAHARAALSALQTASEKAASKETAHLLAFQTLSRGVAPLWAKHLEMVKTQIDESGNDLARRFGVINDRLNAAAAAARAAGAGMGSQGPITTLISSAQVQLMGVAQLLSEALSCKRELLVQMSELVTYAEDLEAMAQTVSKIAKQTNLLALNASIEAARAGEHGRGFSVVADEVRKLSVQSDDSGRRMIEVVSSISAAIRKTQELAFVASEQEQVNLGRSEATISQVTEEFQLAAQSLSAVSDNLLDESLNVKNDVDEVLVDMQYHDRVSQIMSHIQADIHRYIGAIDAASADAVDSLDVRAWLAEMEKGYTTLEQHAIHAGKKSAGPAETDVTFF